MSILIKNANVISHSTKGTYNVYIKDNIIYEISRNKKKADIIIDANGLTLIPGIIDMHTHLREPGFEYKEAIKTGLSAAVHGGVTTIGVMPNTNPAMDNLEIIKFVENKAKKVKLGKVIPIPTITKKRKGEELNNLMFFFNNGYRFFSDDGNPVWNDELMLNALNIVKKFNGVIINHCEDKRFLNIPLFESLMVARDMEISKFTKGHVHIAHISTGNSIDLIKYAKINNLNVSCEITFHHLLLNNYEKDPFKKINPPLPDVETQRYLIENIDYIDMIVSDHAPHSLDEKNKSFDEALNGISGLDIFFPAIVEIHNKYRIDLDYLIEKITYNSAKVFSLKNIGDIKEGYNADLVLVDTEKKWNGKIFSKGKNLPYKDLQGRVFYTIVDGEIKYSEVKLL
ncbi:dihydroorotase [Marinitoga hydrogenitolerans DSM 16785]|uniref:Dihydroorotase n=1 Tax=Marinitoga hydrogenitolerans (strain DSM 16785 / JCM 12826 / AT1271) TaxID=1122195 RepID=A0A1M4VIZ6_MARH1|nr:dihydroorotase [Marinitoga hydrogenitolerans]SHE68954.1 dihydroorotase [Marinitoga hydrogenitolerans DSM 16785]